MLFHPLCAFPIILVGSIIIGIGLEGKIFGMFIPNSYYRATLPCLAVFGFFLFLVGTALLLAGSIIYSIIAIALGLCISLNRIINMPDSIKLTAFVLIAAGLCRLFSNNKHNRYRSIRPYARLSQAKFHQNVCRNTACSRRNTYHQ